LIILRARREYQFKENLVAFWIDFLGSFNLRSYREKKNRLAWASPWSYFAGRFEEGIVLLKTGALMRCYSFICPDLGSASAESVNAVSFYFNEAVKKLDSSWAMQFEAQRILSREYPSSSWTNDAGFLIDKRREKIFQGLKEHFLSRYFLTFTYKLKPDIYSKTAGLLYKKDGGAEGYYNLEECRKETDYFRDETAAAIAHLQGRIYIEALNNDACASYLHSSVSSRFYDIRTPRRFMLLDHYITDDDLEVSTTLRLGNNYIPIIAVRDFPNETYPAIFACLNEAKIPYRWSSRWISRSKLEASRDIEKYQKRFYGSRKSWGQAIAESLGNFESGREDPAARAFEEDTNQAKVELSTDSYSFGYYTGNIMVADPDYEEAMEKARYIVGLVNSTGFNAKIETVNAYNAFLSMQPGNVYANVRRPVISSGNLSHIIPLSSVWEGQRHSSFTEERFGCSSPLLTCSTSSKVAFFLNLNVGDVGHTFIFGPSGAGKSTLLSLLESQFLKYKGANVVIFDKDRTARSVTLAAGGYYVEPGKGEAAFQPLRFLETEGDLAWAQDFIKLLLEMQGLKADALVSSAVIEALRQMKAEKKPSRRTLSTFQQYVSYTNPETGLNDIRLAVQPYTLNGEYGALFDAEEAGIHLSKWLMIEMGYLMSRGEACVTPALMYLFHLIEGIYTDKSGNPTGDPTLLILDEAWVFLDNEYFSRKIEEWLVTLRKKNVFCVFATQEVSKVASSRLKTTFVSQCQTKIYLADPAAGTAVLRDYYRFFGLEDNEIAALSLARMKRDYFYKSPLGSRMFELCLDDYQLALLSPDHALLDELEAVHGRNSGKELAREILQRKGFSV
jgi:type IV secretion system protein VirB4